jgi:prolyl 4-hydroxylase
MATTTQSLADESLISGEWYGWIQENVLRQCNPEEILSVLIANGFSAESSQKTISFVMENPTLPVEVVKAVSNELLSGDLLTGEWYDWVKENVTRQCNPEEMLSILIANGFDSETSQRTIRFVQENPTLNMAENVFTESSLPNPKSSIQTPSGLCETLIRIEKPVIVVYKNFMSDEECDELVRLSASKLKRSTTVGDVDGKEIVHQHRTSDGGFFQRGETEFIKMLEERCTDLMNLPIENGEGIQVLRYEVGGEYRPHFDYFPTDKPGSAPHLQKGGQRVATLILYLNTVEAGGETLFPKLNLKVSAKKGQAVYFSYFDTTTNATDPLSLHGGAPIVAGEKWIATKWMRERVYK